MKLITKEIENKVPKFYETDGKSPTEKYVHARFFNVFNGWEWYLLEYDKETNMGYGVVKGWETEYGYFDIKELQSNHTERDRSFAACLLSELYDKGII